MATTVTFDNGAQSCTIKAPRLPEEPGDTYPMTTGATMGGGLKYVDMGDGTIWDRPKLHFRGLTSAHYAALKTFIQTNCEWSKTAFTYTDPHGTDHTNMHYLRGFPFKGGPGDLWSGTLELHKDMSA